MLLQFELGKMQIHQTWVQPRQPIWVHRNQQFVKAVIKQVFKEIISCTLQSGQNIKVKRNEVFHRNPLPIQPSRTNLMDNDVINQPEILNHLAVRFKNNKIYTFVQNTLIAVNPYFLIPALYTDEQKGMYMKNIIESKLSFKDQEPHIYAITAQMVKALFQEGRSQSVIISGESGAGKTEVNKECLRFLGFYFNSLNLKDSDIQRAIILSTPILEAFGNSKTIRNNNSSRFGKYLAIMIDSKTKQIKHAQIYNYLLQKSRIISRSKDEQNFHVFYQFLTKTTKMEKQQYCLIDSQSKRDYTFQDFYYTQNDQQKEYFAHPDISFEKIKQSLKILPDPRSFDYLCRILSVILHLGNLEPYQDENLDYCQIMPHETFDLVGKLLQIDKKLLFESLTSYSIKIGGQDMTKCFSKRQVQQLIHSLSKTLYQRLFQWIINQINRSTRSKDKQTNKLVTLGFLDIYGFEVLKTNSLEQLFINYTNQRLHQLYLQKIFKLQKEQFIMQKLEHKFKQIDFEDNIKVLELIDYLSLSIFNLLDDQCGIASPDESSFITKIRFNHKKHEKFPVSNLNLVSTQFLIKHTPQQVQYSVVGFREKNKDLLRQEIKITMRSSKLKVLQQMFEDRQQGQADSKSHKVRKYLSSKFRKEMNELIEGLLNKTEQHFIRCIKSNGSKKPMEIEQEIVYSQIKYLGILDTIKIKKMGYSVKIKYEDMDKRFSWFVRNSHFDQPAEKSEVISSVNSFLPKFGEEQILFGTSRIFFRDYAFTVCIQKYEKYKQYLNKQAHLMTSVLVRFRYYRKKERKKRALRAIQRYFKGVLAERKLKNKVESIIKIQRKIASYLFNINKVKKLESIQILQAYIKRIIQSKAKSRKMNLIEKVVNRFKFCVFRKRIRSKIAANYIIEKVLFANVWQYMKQKNQAIISTYINAFKVKIMRKQQINVALQNERNLFEVRSLNSIQSYILAVSQVISSKKKIHKIQLVQAQIKGFIARKRYQKKCIQIIMLQRAIRQYLFLKKGSKELFEGAYGNYGAQLSKQNIQIQKKLYDSQYSNAQNVALPIKKFLTKFKEKISLLYFVIDFEAFVDMEIVYPNSSWAINYLEVFEQGLQKNDPIQYLSVGETFTVVSTTTKMFLWGMHDSYKNLEPDAISQIKTKMPVQFYEINRNKLNFSYVKDEELDKKSDLKDFKISSTMTKDFNLENGKIYQCLPNEIKLIKGIPLQQRVVQISCGRAHSILRTSAKKVYSFGYGRQGQLGHSSFNSQENPKMIRFFDTLKTSHPIQVSASFSSSLVLMSNRKLYWFGKNGTLNQVNTPTVLQLKSKLQIMNSNQFSILRILPTWSRTLSVIGVTIICYNKKFENNLALRNKTTDILISKWHQVGIYNINPPIIPTVSDHLEQCHVKMRSKKINIHPEGKAVLKQMQQKIKSVSSIHQQQAHQDNQTFSNRNSIGIDFSFANTQRNSFYK